MTLPAWDVARSVARRFCVLDATRFQEDGRTVALAASRLLRPRLAERIYVRCHLRQPAAPAPLADAAADARLRRALRARLAGGSYMDGGWTLVARDGAQTCVRKDGLMLTVAAHEFRHVEPVAAGEDVKVRLPTHWPCVLRGWFVVVSRHGQPAGKRGLWRVYADVRPENGADAVSMLRGWLEVRGARFQLKLLDASALGTRPDGLVAFLAPDDVESAVRCLQIMHRRGWLRDGSPGFAARVSDGIALAPEPPAAGPPRSFGQHCAGVAADAVIEAWQAGIDDEEARRVLIADRLERDAMGSAPVDAGARRCL